LGKGFFVNHRIISAVNPLNAELNLVCHLFGLLGAHIIRHVSRIRVKRVEFVSDRMSYIILRGCWCNIIVLNVHAPSEGKCDDSKGNFYLELEQVFNHFPNYCMIIVLGDLKAKVGRENIFKQAIE
jgi:hypothetical protein